MTVFNTQLMHMATIDSSDDWMDLTQVPELKLKNCISSSPSREETLTEQETEVRQQGG